MKFGKAAVQCGAVPVQCSIGGFYFLMATSCGVSGGPGVILVDLLGGQDTRLDRAAPYKQGNTISIDLSIDLPV